VYHNHVNVVILCQAKKVGKKMQSQFAQALFFHSDSAHSNLSLSVAHSSLSVVLLNLSSNLHSSEEGSEISSKLI
jgi:aspartate carbamoyltransferase catalytic subunit